MSIQDVYIINGKEESDSHKIADSFCKFFTDVGKQYASKIPETNKSIQDFLSQNRNPHSIFLAPCDAHEVTKFPNSYKLHTVC